MSAVNGVKTRLTAKPLFLWPNTMLLHVHYNAYTMRIKIKVLARGEYVTFKRSLNSNHTCTCVCVVRESEYGGMALHVEIDDLFFIFTKKISKNRYQCVCPKCRGSVQSSETAYSYQYYF